MSELKNRANLVSVVVPCYNRSSLIARTLDSVTLQTHRPIEVIVVDDGSTDNTVELVEIWLMGLSDAQFTGKLICKKNGGPGSARNVGVAASKGEFIQYLDSDDLLCPDKIAAHIDAILQHDAEFAWSPMAVEPLSYCAETEPQLWFTSPLDFPDSGCVGLYRRSLIDRIGPWREDLYTKEDYDYRYRTQIARPKKVFVPGVKYRAFQHDYGRENDKFGCTADIEAVLQILDGVRHAITDVEFRRSIAARYHQCLDSAVRFGETALAQRACTGLKDTATSRTDSMRALLFSFLLRWGGFVLLSRIVQIFRWIRRVMQLTRSKAGAQPRSVE